MDLPLDEALTYLIIMLEEEQKEQDRHDMQLYMNHLSRILSRPPETKETEEAAKNFMDNITPQAFKKAPELALEWDFDNLNIDDD